MEQRRLVGPDGVRWVPDAATGVGALVVAGSSGRVDSPRAELLARQGALAESIRWFGGAGQPAGPWDVPLETFIARVDDLARDCDRVVVLGTSFGAEAALHVGALCPAVTAVVGFAPSDVTWAGVRPDGSVTSHWTLGGEPLPFVAYDDGWTPDNDVPAYVGLYAASRERFAADLTRAAIPVEQIGTVVVVAGGDDQVWPSVVMAESIRHRRADAGRETLVVTDADAGHRTILPGEAVVTGGTTMRRGGTEEADRRIGAAAWSHVVGLLSG
ncbi:acyl-CoA thioester hydrolase/BAAT C-terminal domain-containing protein [Nocardioides sp. MH1]|uniref:acyl-CoA thioester hydrolase/BAAT C-terminal domain-containing protein n=1 Tax=Nocardioides sp. MH1 TaxID=3242490 RepID=UPI0035222626